MFKSRRLNLFLIVLLICLASPFSSQAAQAREKEVFFVEPEYDLLQRQEVTGVLIKTTSQIYFYAEEEWWNSAPRTQVYQSLNVLDVEFEGRIYPILTSNYGFEWKPGIDADSRITILIHPMKSGTGGYFRSGDEYLRLQVPESNEREMIYLNSDFITSSIAKSHLAHEFAHLINFNQKNRINGVEEETWLNEARADYAPTLVGYDNLYQGSNLQSRVRTFLKDPSDSITEWEGDISDYGALNVFFQYLVEHYGKEILIDSLESKRTGISSLNHALENRGFEKRFSDIFTDWAITVLINDCELGNQYCYFSDNLNNLKIVPITNILPFVGESALTLSDTTKDWEGNWYKFVGGKGSLKFEFEGSPFTKFTLPYIIEDSNGNFEIRKILIPKGETKEILIPNFGTKKKSLIVMPLIESKIFGFNGFARLYQFSWSASVTDEQGEAELIKKLLAQIEELTRQIAIVQAQINAILSQEQVSCSIISHDLRYGMNSNQVKYLQEFLKSQGPEIYPEGLVTGHFGNLTQQAVIRFQEKYRSQVLDPLGLGSGTGYVGASTRAKINSLK